MGDVDLSVVDFLWFRGLAGIVVGLCLGSFVTMLSHRLPRKQSIIRPASRCANCGAALGVWDLFPVFSWLFLRGRCRRCGVAISVRYPIIELVTALGALALFISIGFDLLLFPALMALIAVVCFITIWLENSRSR
ncbi:MAG: prepilin peptidase [Bdellovibrionales bacterium]